MSLPDRMTVDGAPYAVLMSRSAFNWLVRGVLGPVVYAGPSRWSHGGRLAFARLETLARRCKHVEVRQRGRVVRLTSKDARTVLALLEAAAEGIVTRTPPSSAQALGQVLRWQVGDLRELPGLVPLRIRESGGFPVAGGYVYLGSDWGGWTP